VLKDLSKDTTHLRLSSGVSNKIDDSTTQKKRSFRKSLKNMLGGKTLRPPKKSFAPKNHLCINADIWQDEAKTPSGLPPLSHNVHHSGTAQM
jgi:hypothetical protein